MRSQITTKMPEEVIEAIDIIGAECEITRSNYLEIISTLSILNNTTCPLGNDKLNKIISSLITKSSCSIRKDFKLLHYKLLVDMKKAIIKFFYEINLIPEIRYSCVKQANFYKRDEYLFYYAILDMKNIDIDIYVEGLTIQVVGIYGFPSNEYLYLGRKRYFNRSDQESRKFDDICLGLNISPCDVIKIHYTELSKLISVLREI